MGDGKNGGKLLNYQTELCSNEGLRIFHPKPPKPFHNNFTHQENSDTFTFFEARDTR